MERIRIRQILFATDFLECSRLALDYAVALAHHFHATLLLLHAVELSPAAEEVEAMGTGPSVSRKAAEDRIENFASGIRRLDIAVATSVVDGTPRQVIQDAVGQQAPDLLVLGVHGVHRGINHLLIGSSTEKLLQTVTCPVLSVGAHVLAGIDLHIAPREILYCSDLSPEAAAAAVYALRLGEEFKVPVAVCQLARPDAEVAITQQTVDSYCAALRRLAPDANAEWCTPEFHLQRTITVDGILQRAETQQSGLIVLGVHAESQLGRHLHTSIAYQLLTRSVCPVLSIRAGPQSI
ncbi:MAG TPA: universal stress protein [Bryocella sp.]|nr:universal stress protein [Bryocella sp.]